MARAPFRRRRNAIEVSLDLGEAAILTRLCNELSSLFSVPPAAAGEENADRHLRTVSQLEDAHAQHVPVDHRHPLQRPPVGELPDERVDLVAVLLDAAGQLHGIGVGLGREVGQQLVEGRPADVELIAQREGSLPGFPSRPHVPAPPAPSSLRCGSGTRRFGCRP